MKTKVGLDTAGMGLQVHPAFRDSQKKPLLLRELKKLLKDFATHPESVEVFATVRADHLVPEYAKNPLPMIWLFASFNIQNGNLEPKRIGKNEEFYQAIDQNGRLQSKFGFWKSHKEKSRYGLDSSEEIRRAALLDNPLRMRTDQVDCLACHENMRLKSKDYIESMNSQAAKRYVEKIEEVLSYSDIKSLNDQLKTKSSILKIDSLSYINMYSVSSVTQAITLLQSASRNNEIEAALQLLNSHLEKLAPADEKARSEVSKWHRGVFERDTVEAFRVDFKWPKNWIDLAQVTKSWPQSVDYNLHMFSYFFRSPTISPRIGYASVVAAYLFSQSNRQAP